MDDSSFLKNIHVFHDSVSLWQIVTKCYKDILKRKERFWTNNYYSPNRCNNSRSIGNRLR